MKSNTNAVATTESLSAFARRLGVQPSYVTKLRQADRLVIVDGNQVDVEASLARIEATKDPNRDDVAARHARDRKRKKEPGIGDTVPAPDPQAAQISESYTKSRAVKERYLALTAKLEYDRAMGLVVETDQVRRAGAEAGAALRSALENLPDQLAPVLAPVTDEDEIRRLLDDHIDTMLAALAEKFNAAAAVTPAAEPVTNER